MTQLLQSSGINPSNIDNLIDDNSAYVAHVFGVCECFKCQCGACRCMYVKSNVVPLKYQLRHPAKSYYQAEFYAKDPVHNQNFSEICTSTYQANPGPIHFLSTNKVFAPALTAL